MTEKAYHKLHSDAPPAPQGCPVNHTFSPFDPDYLQNPYPQLTHLQATTPIFHAAGVGYLVVTRMEEVLEVFLDPELFSASNVQDPVLPICPAAAAILAADDYNPIAVMSNREQPDHTRIRRFTQAGFSTRRLKVLEPVVRQRAEELVDRMLAGPRTAEFVQAMGHPLPGETIFRLLGFPPADDHQLKQWTGNRLAFTWGRLDDATQIEIAGNMLAYWRYCVAFVKARRAAPADDLTSELLAAHQAEPDKLGYNEVESIVYGLSFAGHEIVSNFLSNALIALLSDRTHWQQLCTDRSLIPAALEEVLRFDSPQTSWRRVVTRDTEFHGCKLPAGTQVFLSLGAANHDPAVFKEPDHFDIRRGDAANHISFGRGIHFCLGSRLAKLEAVIALETLVSQVPTLRLAADQQFSYFPNFTFRGPKTLYLEWD
ncbi:MAG: cytochrome P450 [Gammaproteobacteria bacterium]|nr:cytochrome P450 [Gammaproteobacteria bacterium]